MHKTFFKTKKNKFNAVTCKCKHDHIHDSRAEAGVCNELGLWLDERNSTLDRFEIQFPAKLIVKKKLLPPTTWTFFLPSKTGTRNFWKPKAREL